MFTGRRELTKHSKAPGLRRSVYNVLIFRDSWFDYHSNNACHDGDILPSRTIARPVTPSPASFIARLNSGSS